MRLNRYRRGIIMPSVPSVAPSAIKLPRVWKFWGTLIFGLLAYAALVVAQIGTLIVLLARDGQFLDSPAARNLANTGSAVSAFTLAGVPAVLLVLWLAIRLARQSFADYLALTLPKGRDVSLGAICMILFLSAWDLASHQFDIPITPSFVIDLYISARDTGTIVLLVLALCVAAPITEEFAVRGFLYRGWSESRFGAAGAIVLSAVVWATIHSQYSWYFIGEVFLIGLLLGYWRYRSGPTWLAVMLHSLSNAVALIEAVWFAGQP
jgi:membrane protease YdiL (CAAX protease family)